MLATLENVICGQSFDYVICGGGTAGLTIGTRLTEDPDVSVLVLEAGPANLDELALLLPASFGAHFDNDAFTWPYQTTKQKYAADRVFPWFRGKGLGGSSAVNFMCWNKPSKSEIDDIEALGNPGWNWGNYKKYLSRAEGFVDPPLEVQCKMHINTRAWDVSRSGLIKVAYPSKILDIDYVVQQSFINAGIHLAPNPLGGEPDGQFFAPMSYDPISRSRSYATNAYYLPNETRTNFKVLVTASVDRILFTKSTTENLIASGVQFRRDGHIYTAYARKEVIVCAGALKSPQILELSGIGDRDILESLGVPVEIVLPGVGKNVQEHALVTLNYELKDELNVETFDLLNDPVIAAEHEQLYGSGKGLHTSGVVNLSFLSLRFISDRADAIIGAAREHIDKYAAAYPPGLLDQYKIQLERLERGAPGFEIISNPSYRPSQNPPVPGKRYISLVLGINHLFSRGTIHSVSIDPRLEPEFDPHYLEEDIDMQLWVELVKYARKLATVSPLKEYIAKELNPSESVGHDDAQCREWIKTSLRTTWHTAGSCSMLPRSKGGVVDENLKVYGTENVRVADLSIMPLHFGSHSMATVYAIAEQAADIIKGNLVV